MSEDSDATLARRAAAGDRDAFAALLERHYDRIYRIGIRVLDDAEEAADLAQDVCVGLPAKLPSYRGESKFTTWLYRVAVNAARDALRRKAARQRNERNYAEVDTLRRAEDRAHTNRLLWLRNALGGLPNEVRITVVLVLEEGLRHAEAGRALGVSEATVSWRMHQARKRLRALSTDAKEAS